MNRENTKQINRDDDSARRKRRRNPAAAAAILCAAGLLMCAGCGSSESAENVEESAELSVEIAEAEAETADAAEEITETAAKSAEETAEAAGAAAAVTADKLGGTVTVEGADEIAADESTAGGTAAGAGEAAESAGGTADDAGDAAEGAAVGEAENAAGSPDESDADEAGAVNRAGVDMEAAEAEKAAQVDPAVMGTHTLTVSATGDCTFGVTQEQGYDGSFNAYYDSYGQDYFLSDVRDIFAADDLTIINLECVLTTSDDIQEKAYNLKGSPEYVGIMTGSSIEAVSMGNNHTYDYGDEGFDETVSVVENAGITYAYSGRSGMFVSDDGVKVGIVSANMLPETDEKLNTMISEMQALREDGAEVVIACCHWGIEKDYYPTDYQISTAHTLVDSGADLIIGNHPHVLQSVEVYNGKVICYSLGNFCFGGNMDPEDKNTMIFQQTFTIVDGELQAGIDARIIPCRLSSADDYNNFHPIVASGERYDNIINLVNEYSSMFGTASFDGEGKLETLQ